MLREMETPIYSRLEQYHKENRISFAMPGHKNMRGLGLNPVVCDVTELPKTLNLLSDDKTTERANELLSELYGSKQSFILTCGSTSCIHAMLLGVLAPDDTLLISPDCHISVIHACAIMGVKIKVMGDMSDITHDVAAVLITSPNYYGVVKDIKSISDKCHSIDIPLLVDEAHGAHFTGRYGLPKSAIVLGADIVCQSAHKTLNALTGAAYLHICSDMIDTNRLRTAIRMVHTTSPSYMIAASADIARKTLSECDYTEIINECSEFKTVIEERTRISVMKNDDPTRIVLDFTRCGLTGFKVLDTLSERYMIDVEMADMTNIVLIATPYNRHSDFVSLYHALTEITQDCNGVVPNISKPPEITGVSDPRLGCFRPTEWVALKYAAGRISAATVCMYPPGAALIITGQTITRSVACYIDEIIGMGAEVVGVTDGKIEVVT